MKLVLPMMNPYVFRQVLFGLLLSLCFSLPAFAGDPQLAPTPPMGWNSWDSYGRSITEAQVKSIAEVMAHRLRQFGWQYLVIDEGWYVLNPAADPKDYKFLLSADGRFLPVPDRFPSAAPAFAGFKPLADSIHALGLKFGIHMIRGIPRQAVTNNLPIANSQSHAADAADTSDVCPWNAYNWGIKNNAAGQAYYDSVIKQYAGWGVDFLKVDCIADHPYKPDEIRMINAAIKKAGRPMILSLSPDPLLSIMPARLPNTPRCGASATTSGITGGRGKPTIGLRVSPSSSPLPPSGRHTLARAVGPMPTCSRWDISAPVPERATCATPRSPKTNSAPWSRSWSIFRSPLIIGGDLLSLDDWTASLLTNPEVIAVDQHSQNSHAVISTAPNWCGSPNPPSTDATQSYYLAVFNIGDTEQTFHYTWKDLGLNADSYQLRDLWDHKAARSASNLTVKLRPHASVLYRLTPAS